MPHPILLYDGVCGLCNRLVQFILRRDRSGVFRFASLQSALAAGILARHGADARDLDTVYVVVNYELSDERLLARSDAVVFILKQLAAAAELRSARPGLRPGPTQATSTPGRFLWRLVAFLLQVVPRRLRDWGYGLVARHRYRVFGRYDACPLPSEDTRSRFLDL
ncbi:MAG: thiol-disulfide oxidoreductase DCC family protein [Candidatus Sulfotelmatobacter sp.]